MEYHYFALTVQYHQLLPMLMPATRLKYHFLINLLPQLTKLSPCLAAAAGDAGLRSLYIKIPLNAVQIYAWEDYIVN